MEPWKVKCQYALEPLRIESVCNGPCLYTWLIYSTLLDDLPPTLSLGIMARVFRNDEVINTRSSCSKHRQVSLAYLGQKARYRH